MKQMRNQYTGAAGITQREADRIHRSMRAIRKISHKKNLYIRYKEQLDDAYLTLYKVLLHAERLP